MFSIFRSRVVKHGEQCAQSICDAVVDKEVIMQLILEDIEGASMGNDKAKSFARASGISPKHYQGALNHSRPEVDGPKGIKTFLDQVALEYLPNLDKVAEFRLAATDYIMRFHRIGKYSK